MLSELKNAVKFGDDNYDFMRKFQVWLNEKNFENILSYLTNNLDHLNGYLQLLGQASSFHLDLLFSCQYTEIWGTRKQNNLPNTMGTNTKTPKCK